MITSSPIDFLLYLAPSVPICLVWLVAIVLALIRWQRHPSVSLFTCLGSVVLLVAIVGGNMMSFYLIRQQSASGWSSSQVSTMLSVIGFARSFLAVGGYVLLLIAVFGWRPAERVAFERPPVRLLEEGPSTAIQGDS
jgi:hypothetical protein